MVERAGRLVEKPNRCRRRDQSGERDPPTLARGKPTARPVGDLVEGKCGHRFLKDAWQPAWLDTPERRPERQSFARRQTWLHTVLMADKVKLRAVGGVVGLDRRSTPE